MTKHKFINKLTFSLIIFFALTGFEQQVMAAGETESNTVSISVIARIKIKAETNADFERTFLELTKAVKNNESGNLLYSLNHASNDALSYVILEQYSSQEAFDAHQGSAHFKSFGEKLGIYFAGPPEMEVLRSAQ